MIQRTLTQSKEVLQRIAGQTGYEISDTRLTDAINEATEELINTGDYPNIMDRYTFSVYEGYFVLPYFLQRVDGLAYGSNVIERRPAWFEFLQYGPGPQDALSDVEFVLDREEVAIHTEIPSTGGPYKMKITATIDERVDSVQPSFIIKGYD